MRSSLPMAFALFRRQMILRSRNSSRLPILASSPLHRCSTRTIHDGKCNYYTFRGRAARKYGTSNNTHKSTRVHLPKLGQNGTLVLRSNSRSIAKVQILPQWRDDASLEVLSISDEESPFPTNNMEIERGSSEAVSIFDSSEKSSKNIFGRLQLSSNEDGRIATSLGRKGTLVEVDVMNSPSEEGGYNDDELMEKQIIIATVPEKSNVTIQISNGDKSSMES